MIKYDRKTFFDIKDTCGSVIISDELAEMLELINNDLFDTKFSVHKSEWRKKKPSILDKHLTDEERLKHSINSELNKISSDNYVVITDTIKTILSNITIKYDEILSFMIDNIFDKAVTQPNICPYYIKLTYAIMDDKNKQFIITLLRNKCTMYHTILTKQHSNAKENKDETNYDEYCNKLKRKTYQKGFSQFIGELHNYDTLTSKEILFFYKQMITNIINCLNDTGNTDEDLIEDNIVYLHKLVEVSLGKLISDKNNAVVTKFAEGIKDIINDSNIAKISQRLQFKLKDCYDLFSKKLKLNSK